MIPKFAPLVLAALMACSPSATNDSVVHVDTDDEAMNAAIAEARATVQEFVQALTEQAPGDTYFAIKVPIHDGVETEHFWLTEVAYSDGTFTGIIDNTPELVSNVKEGQPYEIAETEISDWVFFRDGVAIGNRTVRVLFLQMPDEDVAALKEMFGWN